jgi:hypothetical protein
MRMEYPESMDKLFWAEQRMKRAKEVWELTPSMAKDKSDKQKAWQAAQKEYEDLLAIWGKA